MSEALYDIADLFSTQVTSRTTKKRRASMRNGKRVYESITRASAEKAPRRSWFDESHRTKPSLPRVKWLERPDP